MEASSPAIAYGPSAGFPVGLKLFGDERLAKLVATGNERAFAVLFERYHQPLYRYCRSILRHESDAQDALQSAFAGALVALRRGQRDAPLKPWLFRIAHNESISLLRRRRTSGLEIPEGTEPLAASAEERAQEREQLALLVADLQELPDRQRGALVMRELSGLSHEEIAAALGTSPGTAKQAIFEARSALLEFAEGRAMSCDEICRTVSDGDRRALRARRVRAHLRECSPCAAFAAAIPARRAELRAMTAPLAPLAAAGLLARLTGGGSALGGSGGGSAGGGALSTVAGKLAAAGLTGKALVTAAVVTGAAAGVAGTLNHVAQPGGQPGSAPVSARPSPGSAASAAAPGQMRPPAIASSVAAQLAYKHRSGRQASTSSQTARHHGRAAGSAHGQAAAAHAKTHGRANAAAHSSASSGASSRGGQSSAHRSNTTSSHAAKSQGTQHAASASTQPGPSTNAATQATSNTSARAGGTAVAVAKPAPATQQAPVKTSAKALH